MLQRSTDAVLFHSLDVFSTIGRNMNEEDVFCELRENFLKYWNATFADDDFAHMRSRSPHQASQLAEKILCDEDKIADDALEITELLQPVLLDPVPNRAARIEPILSKLDQLSEYLHVIKVRVFPNEQIPFKIWDRIKLITYDMFRVKLELKSKVTVRWYAHLLFQCKFITPRNSRSYRRLLQSFSVYWTRLVPNSTNNDKRYVHKLYAFVKHISSIEREQEKGPIGAHKDLNDAQSLFEETQNWRNDEMKNFILEVVRERIASYYKVARPEGTIGPEGGILHEEGCKFEVPECALDDYTKMRIKASVEDPKLPDDMVPLSPTLICTTEAEISDFKAIVEVPRFGHTNSDKPQIIVMSQVEGCGWQEGESMSLKNSSTKIVGQSASDPNHSHASNKDHTSTTDKDTESSAETTNDVSVPENTADDDKTKTHKVHGIPNLPKLTHGFLKKIVIAVKKAFEKDIAYDLTTDVWYSKDGNFTAVCSVSHKMVFKSQKRRMKEAGFKRAQGIMNPIRVLGNDAISVQMENRESNIVVFEKARSGEFTVIEKDITRNRHGYGLSFRLKTLPVGNERLELECAIYCKEKKEESTWNLSWPDLSGGDIMKTFRQEVIPSFRPNRVHNFPLWKIFFADALELKIEDFTEEFKDHWIKHLITWLGIEERRGTKRNELQALVREMTIKYREKKL